MVGAATVLFASFVFASDSYSYMKKLFPTEDLPVGFGSGDLTLGLGSGSDIELFFLSFYSIYILSSLFFDSFILQQKH